MTETDASPGTDWRGRLDTLQSSALSQLEQAVDAGALEQWRISHLGRKSALSDLMGGLGKLSVDERRAVGSAANEVKRALEQAYADREATVRAGELAQSLERERIDVTLPGRPPALGALHPITRTIE